MLLRPRQLVNNICLSEGPVPVIAILQVQMHRDLELQICRDFIILKLQMSRDLVTTSNVQKISNFRALNEQRFSHNFKCAKIF